jgi:hypothetical protein
VDGGFDVSEEYKPTVSIVMVEVKIEGLVSPKR